MKKSLKYLFLLILSLSFSEVKAELVQEGNTFIEQSVNQDIELPFTYKDKSGKEYRLYQSKKGAIYIIKTSEKTGKEYKYYLPKEKQEHIKQHLKLQNNG